MSFNLAPFQVNVIFRNNLIGKVVVQNAADLQFGGGGAGGPADLLALNGELTAAGEEMANTLGGYGGNGGDVIQVNDSNQDQDVDQSIDQNARIRQETGDTFSIAVDFGDGSAVSIAAPDAVAVNDQTATNRNRQTSRQSNTAQ
jgi:hypothetical protein